MMGRTRQSLLYLFLLLILFVLVNGCSSPTKMEAAPSEAVCSALVDAKCVRCHYKTRICDALGTKSVRKWEKTLKFMVKQGAQLSQDEQSKVLACLSSMPKGSAVVCK
jgi:hypothetical protein